MSIKPGNVLMLLLSIRVDNAGNFRPIPVVAVTAKILEKIVCNQLRSIRYCFTSYRFWEIILFRFCRFTKIDSLDRALLLQRLHNLGVWGKELAWFSSYLSYLSDHKKHVKSGGMFSEWSTINGRILQGSSLGPLLFLIYMNGMPSQA